jgi:hypothetical protein
VQYSILLTWLSLPTAPHMLKGAVGQSTKSQDAETNGKFPPSLPPTLS